MDGIEDKRWLALSDVLNEHTNLLNKIVELLTPPDSKAPSETELLLQAILERLDSIDRTLDTRLPEPKPF
jgi:hypothetical protein